MPDHEPDSEDVFERIVARHLSDASVSAGTGFGKSPGLRVDGKVYAMLIGGELIAKLPRSRVDDLVAAGRGNRFDPGHGRVMKEWIAVPATHAGDWGALAQDALAYVGRRPG